MPLPSRQIRRTVAKNRSSIVPLAVFACEVSIQAVSAEMHRQELVAGVRDTVPMAELQAPRSRLPHDEPALLLDRQTSGGGASVLSWPDASHGEKLR